MSTVEAERGSEGTEKRDSETRDSERRDSEKRDSEKRDSEKRDSEKRDSEKRSGTFRCASAGTACGVVAVDVCYGLACSGVLFGRLSRRPAAADDERYCR